MKTTMRAIILTCSSVLLLQAQASAQSFGQLKSAAMEAQSAKRYDEADRFWQKAMDSCQDKSGPRYIQSMGGLAKSLTEQGKTAEAETLYKAVLESSKPESSTEDLRAVLKDYATLLRQLKRTDDASKLENDYTLANDAASKAKEPSQEELAAAAKKEAQEKRTKMLQEAQQNLADGNRELNGKQLTLAEQSGQKALKLAEEAGEASYTIPALKLLTLVYDAENKTAQAEAVAKRCAEMNKSKYGTVSRQYADALNSHAEILRKLNRKTEAIAEEGRVDDIKSKLNASSSGSAQGGNAAGVDNSAAIAGTRGGSLYKRAGSAQNINNSVRDIGD